MNPLPMRVEKVVSFVSLEKLMQLVAVIMPSGRWLKEVYWENRIYHGREMVYLSLEWDNKYVPHFKTRVIG